MISSNSSVDFINVLRAAGQDPAVYMQTPEFREWFDDYLAESVVTVHFTKKDGTERVMRCTRNFETIPSEKHPKGSLEKTSTDAVRVFDVEIQDWRSFNISNINRIDWE